jgi:hypothetical protein
MRLANACCWMILLVGCGGRVQIGFDWVDAGTPGSDSDGKPGTEGTGGQGGNGAAGGAAGVGGFGGVAGTSTTGGAGGDGAMGGAAGIGGAGGASGDGGASGSGGATTGVGGTAGSGGDGTGGATTGVGGTTGSGGASGTGGTGASGSGGSSGAAGTGGSGPSADAGGIPPWPTPTPCPPNAPSPLVGQWVGRVQNYQFPSGSDLVHLSIEGADGTSFCGSITYGVAPHPPPATNPDVGYPPGVDIHQLRSTAAWHAPYEGFNYRLMNATVQGNSIRFHTLPREVWKSWCVLQSSYLSIHGHHRCIPNGMEATSREADGGAECAVVDGSSRTVVDCDKMLLCGGTSVFESVCQCNAVGCNASGQAWTFRDLTAVFDGVAMKGNLQIEGGRAYEIELTRNEPAALRR